MESRREKNLQFKFTEFRRSSFVVIGTQAVVQLNSKYLIGEYKCYQLDTRL